MLRLQYKDVTLVTEVVVNHNNKGGIRILCVL